MRDQHRCHWHRWFALLIVGAALLSLAVPSANADPPRYECPPGIAECTTVTGDWIDVPTSGTVWDHVECPSGEPVGYSYEGGRDPGREGHTDVLVNVFPNYPNASSPWADPIRARWVRFRIRNLGYTMAVRDRIGCAPASGPKAAAAAVEGFQQVRTWTDKLGPSQTRSYTHGCSRGRHLVKSEATVEFLTQRRPSLVELTAVKWHDRAHGNRDTVRVSTTQRLRKSARAVIEMSIFCDSAGVVAAAPAATAASPRYECPPSIANCTTVTRGWIDLPRGASGQDQVTCPSDRPVPVGFSYEGGIADETEDYIQVFKAFPFTWNPWNPAAGADLVWFQVWNDSLSPTTIRDLLGCAPATALAAALKPVRALQRERTFTERLAPSETKTVTHGCPRGRRLAEANATAEFLTRRRPSIAKLTAVKVHERRHGNSDTVRVTTTAQLGKRAHAILNIYLFCDA